MINACQKSQFLLDSSVMLEESRVDGIDTFVKEFIRKIILQAMDVVDSSIEDTTSRSRPLSVKFVHPVRRNLNEQRKNRLSIRGAQQTNERIKKSFTCETDHDDHRIPSIFRRSREPNSTHDVDRRASEEIRKIVYGLQGVQIGDVSSIQRVAEISSLEREVKRAVEEIGRSNEIPILEGQGDVHDGAPEESTPKIEEVEHEAKDLSPPIFELLENSVDDNRETQRQVQQQQEVSKLRSTCFLHRMIKELENAEASQENVLRVCNSISGISQERIAAWEESEEKFIRTIEGTKLETDKNAKLTDNPLIIEEPITITPVNDVPPGCIVEVEIEEVVSATPSPLPSSSQITAQFAEVKEISKSLQQDSKLEKSKTKTKKSLGAKLRKFFRMTFKRSKDC